MSAVIFDRLIYVKTGHAERVYLRIAIAFIFHQQRNRKGAS